MMKVPVLETNNPHLKLIEPDIERDAANGIKWLEGDMGRTTLRLMGSITNLQRLKLKKNE